MGFGTLVGLVVGALVGGSVGALGGETVGVLVGGPVPPQKPTSLVSKEHFLTVLP